MKTKARGAEAGKREEERWKSEQASKSKNKGEQVRDKDRDPARRVEYERRHEMK